MQEKKLKQKFDMLREDGKWLRICKVSPVRGKDLRWEGFAKKVGFDSHYNGNGQRLTIPVGHETAMLL